MNELSNVHYDAFISYRHSELDSFVAENLHRKLESFRLPKSVQKKGGSEKKRIERVFRDVDELPLSDDLSEPINTALANSDYLITICTPRYLESKWCMKEIEVFLQTHERDHILVVLAEDEPKNSFPTILTCEEITDTDENGKEITIRREFEPLAADTRGENKKEILKAMDTAVIKLCAAIFGLNYDDLKQRHREQKIRRMIAVFGSIGAAVLAFAIFATVMFIKIGRQNELISEQYGQLQDRYAGTMATAAETLFGEGRRMDAVYAARSVLPEDPENAKPNAAALKSLYTVMNVYGINNKFVPVCVYEGEREIVGYEVSADGAYLLMYDDETIRVFESDTGEKIRSINRSSEYDEFQDDFEAHFCGTEGIVVVDGEEVYFTAVNDRGSREKLPEIRPDAQFFPAEDGSCLLICSNDKIYALDDKGKQKYSIDLSDWFSGSGYTVMLADFDDGVFLCSLCEENNTDKYYLLVADLNDGEILTGYSGEGNIWTARIVGDEIFVSVTVFDVDTIRSKSVVYRTDYHTDRTVWNREMSGLMPDNIVVNGEHVFVRDAAMVAVMDRETGETIQTLTCGGSALCEWPESEDAYFLDDNGSLYCCTSWGEVIDDTGERFVMQPTGDLMQAVYAEGDLYFLNVRSNYIVRYSAELCEDAEACEEEELWYDWDPEEAKDDVEEVLADGESLPDAAIYSEDGELIYTLYPDYTVRIYDADTVEELSSFDISEGSSYYDRLFRLEEAECYVLTGYGCSLLLNGDYEPFCEISAMVYGEEDGDLLLLTEGWEFCRTPWIGYEELLQRADEYLDGYEPSEMIRRRYSIQ